MDISDDTCCCYGCGSINVGLTLEECDSCPECGSLDIGSYEDLCHDVDEAQEQHQGD